MKLLNQVKGLLTGLRQVKPKEWWVEIITAQPSCIYYFGPFQSASEAKATHPGYVEDLQGDSSFLSSLGI
ncbi:DUF1816 domain-containing protein [Leptolyngbya sp. AN03gr2]|uniref:DUF1816 domain-containing protein n=1 Tax=unclassified Leptolyngbya TaxID=2650499 RepID=UPI003D3200E2